MKNSIGEFQNIVVLGGRSDIGTEIAAKLTSSFTKKVVLAGRGMVESDVEKFREALSRHGSSSVEVELQEFDASANDSHYSFAERVAQGGVDLVILAFGQLGDQEAMWSNPVFGSDLVAVNMAGMVSAGMSFADVLARQGAGHMLFISSVAGIRTRPANFVYGSTKAGMDAFAQGLCDALHPKGVNVTIVRPGFVRTSMTEGMKPAPFAIDAGRVADLVHAGLRRGQRVIWAPGILKFVFGILRSLPAAVWRRLPIN